MTETLLYLVYGDMPTYQLELGYSVLSAVAHRGERGPRIVLMTDEAGRRDDLPVEHFIFSAEDLARWTDNGRYNHACKVHAYIAALRHFGGKVAMIDTDTYFLADPMQVFDRVDADTSLMHDWEGMLGSFPEWNGVIRRAKDGGIGGYPIAESTVMYNSGVVGCDIGMLEAVEGVPAFMDAVREAGGPFNAEQFAFSQILLRAGTVGVCPDLLRHYWGFERRFIHCRIARLMPEQTGTAFEAALANSATPVAGYPERSVAARLRAKIKGAQRKGQGGLYPFAYLCYLSALGESRPDYADAWAGTALDVIRVGGFAAPLVKRDFRRLAPGRSTTLPWLTDATRRRWSDYWATA